MRKKGNFLSRLILSTFSKFSQIPFIVWHSMQKITVNIIESSQKELGYYQLPLRSPWIVKYEYLKYFLYLFNKHRFSHFVYVADQHDTGLRTPKCGDTLMTTQGNKQRMNLQRKRDLVQGMAGQSSEKKWK